jgi:3-deoxy-7-phosphoheptulonate synthase
VGLIGNDGQVEPNLFQNLAGVLEVIPVSHSYKQVSREWRDEDTIVELPNGTRIGGREIALMAGPCAVESEEQILGLAETLGAMGATILRGGAFKPRSSPYSFQGLGLKGLQLLAEARDRTGMAVVTEALDVETAEQVADYADILQVGARNMQNYALLRKVGRIGKPILLKRGMSATIEELLLAAEYVLAEGNPHVILCERGIRSFDTQTRNLLDLSAIPVVKSLSHLPIIADPSHGTGVRNKVTPMARAAIAAGADGLMVEVHPDPNHALSDGAQSLYPEQFGELVEQIKVIARAINRSLAPPVH